MSETAASRVAALTEYGKRLLADGHSLFLCEQLDRMNTSLSGGGGGGGLAYSGARVTMEGGSDLDFQDFGGHSTIPWTTVEHDVGDWFDAGTDDEIFTIPTGVTKVTATGFLTCRDDTGGDPSEYYGILRHFDGGVRSVASSWGFVPTPITEPDAKIILYLEVMNLDVTAGDTLYCDVYTHSEVNTRQVDAVASTWFSIRAVDMTE